MKLSLLIITLIVANVLSERWYSLNYVSTNISVSKSSCSVQVEEIYEYMFSGVYSTVFRIIQDYTTNGGILTNARVSNFVAIALTPNVVVTSSKIQRQYTSATGLYAYFSTTLADIGIARFKFTYNVDNIIQDSGSENKIIWNNKWEVPVSTINVTMRFTYPTTVSTDDCRECTTKSSLVQYSARSLVASRNYDFTAVVPSFISCPFNAATSWPAIVGYVVAGVIIGTYCICVCVVCLAIRARPGVDTYTVRATDNVSSGYNAYVISSSDFGGSCASASFGASGGSGGGAC
jgi:hypothetical protein